MESLVFLWCGVRRSRDKGVDGKKEGDSAIVTVCTCDPDGRALGLSREAEGLRGLECSCGMSRAVDIGLSVELCAFSF